MISIRGYSPNAAYLKLLQVATSSNLRREESRLGPFLDLGHVIVELDEGERLCILNGRAANPVFSIVEGAWLLSGSNKLSPLQSILGQYGQYSDDGETLSGAYGHRLRFYFGFDQIQSVIQQLRDLPDSRRAVMSLYSSDDLGKDSKDIPCNTQVVCRIENGRLSLSVFNRSNDLWLGVPYNWFAFRALQVLISHELGVPPGLQRHISTCMHLYEKNIHAATKVVSLNTIDSVRKLESTIVPMDMAKYIADVGPLAEANFSEVQSDELCAFLNRYTNYRSSPQSVSTAIQPRQALEVALDLWISERNISKENIINTETIRSNPDSITHLKLQKWVFSDSIDNLLPAIQIAAEKVRPRTSEFLSLTLPIGVRATIDEESANSVCTQLVLELILGCLDPLMSNTVPGDLLRARLLEISRALQLPNQSLIAREAQSSTLEEIFSHILG